MNSLYVFYRINQAVKTLPVAAKESAIKPILYPSRREGPGALEFVKNHS
jgi:hypothetical protein